MVVEPYPTEPGVEDEYNQSPKKDLNRWNPSAEYYIFQWDCFGGDTQINDSISMFGRGNSCDLLGSPYHIFKKKEARWNIFDTFDLHLTVSSCHSV